MKKKKRRPIRLPVLEYNGKVLVSVPPQYVGVLRLPLEGYDSIASFTVLDRAKALLKVFSSPHQHTEACSAFEGIATVLPITARPWPAAARCVEPSESGMAQ